MRNFQNQTTTKTMKGKQHSKAVFLEEIFTGSCFTSPENDSPDATTLSSKSDSGVYINM